MTKRTDRWLILQVISGAFTGITLGLIFNNLWEAASHNVSFYDAVFIESWKIKDETILPPQ